MKSFIYNGLVTHKRFRPVKHFLKYQTFSVLLDLDEIGELDKNNLIFSYNNLTSSVFITRTME